MGRTARKASWVSPAEFSKGSEDGGPKYCKVMGLKPGGQVHTGSKCHHDAWLVLDLGRYWARVSWWAGEGNRVKSILDAEPHCPHLAASLVLRHSLPRQAVGESFSEETERMLAFWHLEKPPKKSILLRTQPLVKPAPWQLPPSTPRIPYLSSPPVWRISSYPWLASLLNMNWYPRITKK